MWSRGLVKESSRTYQIAIFALFQWTISTSQLNIYNVDRTMESDNILFDCLDYQIQREKLAYQELRDITNEIITYCFRPASRNQALLLGTSYNSLARNFNFYELSQENITAEQLRIWSIPINVVEQYQLYLNDPKPSLNEYFYNCTEPWFGPKCQYSFDSDKHMHFIEIVDTIFFNRKTFVAPSDMAISMPCYILIQCHRHGELWCLDWREICDGVIDCFDEGTDEEFCFEMEMNMCNEDEFRCLNGLCIPVTLWEEGEGEADCLDGSDETEISFNRENCFRDPTFHCEEYSFVSTPHQYQCGDGQYMIKLEACHNGRHELLLKILTAKGNLTKECWIAMVCLTDTIPYVNGTSCETLVKSNTIYELLKKCDDFFPFPIYPVYSNHVYFYYENVALRNNLANPLFPDYICFDALLCHYNASRIVHENLTCLENRKNVFYVIFTARHWQDLITNVELYFGTCVTSRALLNREPSFHDNSFLYNCNNTSKFISTYRLINGIIDCAYGDDENYANSCLLAQPHRIKCSNFSKCWSYTTKSAVCERETWSNHGGIQFETFCNGFQQYLFSSARNEILFTDESPCSPAWCDNIYARCDGYPACADARDEYNCTRSKCPKGTLGCISPENYTIICLNSSHFGDKKMDCLGETDERLTCMNTYSQGIVNFKCSDSSNCVLPSQLCDKFPHCHDRSDETFCDIHPVKCEKRSPHNYTEAEKIICSLATDENHQYPYFSLDTSPEHPLVDMSVFNHAIEWPMNEYYTTKKDEQQSYNSTEAWYCNRGLPIHVWNESNNDYKECMCPPSYYGNQCEYQNQRISMTLRLTAIDRSTSYVIVSMLVDENDERREIEAYDQTVYIPQRSCSMKLNRYLLFSMRPKSYTKKYIVRVDAVENTKLTYVGSWYFPIDFVFLPVNKLVMSLKVSNNLIYSTTQCSINCQNGSCVKYLNTEKYFCECKPGWVGVDCSIKTDCQLCSPDSLCIGSSRNQSVCVCPRNKFGPRCILESICPVNACRNNGQCVPSDMSASGNKYTCICSNQYFGSQCQFLKVKVDVNLGSIETPSYVIAYFFTTSNERKPISTITIKKLTLFQQTVTFQLTIPFNMMITQANNKYYLTVLQHHSKQFISTSISPAKECIPSHLLFNATVLKLSTDQKIYHYYKICGERHDMTCFIDNDFLCLCTNDHHANCLALTLYSNFQCSSKISCDNEAKCLQDHPDCPSTIICLCPKCFFGHRCQFFTKGLGATLDEILGYEFKNDINILKQSFRVQLSAFLTMAIFTIGIVNGILTVMTFSREETQGVGCGVYILASSITSICSMNFFALKFWFLLLSQQSQISEAQRKLVLYINCIFIETLLKITSFLDHWYNACVAIERTVSVSQGMNFSRLKSKQVAKCVAVLLPIIMGCLFIPQIINLHIYEDEVEARSWCVVTYSSSLQMYSYSLIFIHYFVPMFINLLSAIFIIIESARSRVRTNANNSFWMNLKIKLKNYKHLVISPIIIVMLTSPYFIISILLDCNKSSNLFWFYLIGYFLSFIPSASVFITFVLPSTLYRQEYKKMLTSITRRFNRLKSN